MTTRYNAYDESKNYRKVLFNPDTPLQSSELNEIQDIALGHTSKLGRFLVTNGTIISGAGVKSISRNAISLEEGSISVDGIPIYVSAGTVSFSNNTGALQNTVGVEIQTEEITYAQDPDILQKDPQSPFYGEPSSDRLKVTGRWCEQSQANISNRFVPVMYVSDGQVLGYIFHDKNKDYVNSSISRYDKGVHGSYCVDGLVLRNRQDLEGSYNPYIPLELSSGTCRVNGLELQFVSSQVLALDSISAEFREVSSEPISFIQGQSSYLLRNHPLKSITRVIGTKEVTKTITRGSSSGGEDTLPDTPVLRIIEIKVGSTIYRQGADFIQVGDKVSWSPSGNEPAPGTQYVCTFQYQSTFNGSIASNRLQLNSSDMQSLVNGTTLSVTYDFYLSRMDRVVVTQEGEAKVYKGVANTIANIFPPSSNEDSEISIGLVTLSYGTQPKIDQNDTVYMVPFKDIRRMSKDISDIQYNLLQLSLKDEAREMDPVTNKRGIIVDPLSNENMRDKGIAKYNNAVINDSKLTVGTAWSTQKSFNENNITLDIKTKSLYRSQMIKTGDMKINPYAKPDSAPVGEIKATPSVIYGNMWNAGYDGTSLPRSTKVSVKFTGYGNAEQIRLRFRGIDLGTVATDNKGNASYELTIQEGTPYGNYSLSGVGAVSRTSGTAVITIQKNSDTFTNWSNQRNLALIAEAENRANAKIAENRGLIDQLAQQLANEINRAQQAEQALQSQLAQQQNELNKAKLIQNDFEKRWRAGQVSDQAEREKLRKQVEALSKKVADTNNRINETTRDLNDKIDKLKQTSNRSNIRIVQDYTALRMARNQTVQVRKASDGVWEFFDPVAQSFTTKAVTNISSVTVEITELPSKDLICKLVEVTAGYPDIYKLVAYSKLPKAQVKLGMNELVFEEIAQLQANKDYAFVIITDSFEGKLAIAEVGQFDQNRNVLHEQADVDGTFFKSSNERTWTAYQAIDMKYQIHQVNYQPSKRVKLGTITGAERLEDLTDFRLVGNVANSTGTGTAVRFYMTVNGKSYDLTLNKTAFIQPLRKQAGDIEVFAELSTTDANYTPILFSGITLLAGSASSPAWYASRQFEIREGRTRPAKIQIVLDQYTPPGTSVEVSYQNGLTDENWEVVREKGDSERALGDGWVEKVYESEANVKLLASRLRLKLSTSHFENRPEVRNIRILVI